MLLATSLNPLQSFVRICYSSLAIAIMYVLSAPAGAAPTSPEDTIRILAFGDSLTASSSALWKAYIEFCEVEGFASVRDYLIRYAPTEQASFIRQAKIRYLDYDWDLNDASGDA